MPRTPAPPSLGTTTRQHRERAGLTQAQLAERAGIADATISRVERGRLHPSADLIGKLATALGVTADDLLKRRVPSKTPKTRPAIAKLVAAVEGLDDGQIDDVRRGIALLLEAGRRSARAR